MEKELARLEKARARAKDAKTVLHGIKEKEKAAREALVQVFAGSSEPTESTVSLEDFTSAAARRRLKA